MSKPDKSLRQRVRDAAQKLGAAGAEFTPAAVSVEVGIQNYRRNRTLFDTLSELCREGVLVRVRRGVYRWPGASPTAPSKQERMWRIARMRRTVTPDDLVELADVSRNYAHQWLRLLVKRGMAKKLDGGRHRLVVDQVEMPVDTEKHEYLRDLRERKKKALDAIDRAHRLIIDARLAISSIDDQAAPVQDNEPGTVLLVHSPGPADEEDSDAETDDRAD